MAYGVGGLVDWAIDYRATGASGNSYCCCCCLGRSTSIGNDSVSSCQASASASSCLSGRWRMLEKQIFILVFARVYICVLFFRVLQNMPLCVCVCLRVRRADSARLLSPSPLTSSVPNPRPVAVVSLPCSEIFREILVIKRAHKYINSFERAAPQLLHSLPYCLSFSASFHFHFSQHTSQFHSYEDGGQVVSGFYTRSAQRPHP